MKNIKLLVIFSSLIFSLTIVSQEAVLEELVVTAQKRESTLMDTSAALVAVSGENLEQAGVNAIDDIALLTPDVQVSGEGKARMGVRIRGVGTYGFDIAVDPSVAMVVDGVTQPRVSTFMNGLDDIERLEILKGPQGAIYGTNALGGIINVVTKKPTQEQLAKVKIRGGNNARQDINLMLQGGVTDSISARFSLIREQDEGVSFDPNSGQDDGVHLSGYRLSLYGESGATEWNLKLNNTLLEQDATISEVAFLCNSKAPGFGAEYFGVAALPANNTNGDVCSANAATTSYQTLGTPNASNPLVVEALADQYSQPMSISGFNIVESTDVSFSSITDLGGMSFTSILGFQKVNSFEDRDFDQLDLNAITQEHAADTETTSIELRLDSDSSNDITWSAGIYAMKDEGNRIDTFSSGNQSSFAAAFGLGAAASAVAAANPTAAAAGDYSIGVNPLAVPNIIAAYDACATAGDCTAYITPGTERPFATLVTAQDVANLNLALTGEWTSSVNVDLDTESLAVFANVKFPLTDQLNLLLAGRYTDHDKPYTYTGATNAPLVPFVTVPFVVNNGSFHEEFNPKATLEYIGDDSLTWLTYAAGFKAGSVGFANFSATAADSPAAMEELEMIELGYKATIQDGRSQIEAIAYQYDYTDHQQLLVCTTAAGPAGCVKTGDATINGLDLVYRTALGPQTRLSVAYSYIDATWDRFLDDRDPTSIQDLAGKQMPQSAENNLNVSFEHVQNTDLGDIVYAVSAAYKDNYVLGLDPWAGVNDVEDYTMVNLNITLERSDNFDIGFFCNNCSDFEYKRVALELGRGGGGGQRYAMADGRRYGIEITGNF